MQAGNISRDGFLGADRRPLAEIIRADEEELKKLNLTHQAIARRMGYFREAGKKGLGEFVPVAPHFEVSCEIARGQLPCPFGEASRAEARDIFAEPSEAKNTFLPCCSQLHPSADGPRRLAKEGEHGRHRKTIVTVRNLRLRKEITFSDLNIHLIAAHGFYEGKGSPFRLEPVELAQVLEIN